mmetsp:Transcript_2772/g.6749  ORF Transcript_2772/g.6749 Transcript_2772/m.6749 type:complete len:202 (+) Transcript_2772:1361-1966(+)
MWLTASLCIAWTARRFACSNCPVSAPSRVSVAASRITSSSSASRVSSRLPRSSATTLPPSSRPSSERSPSRTLIPLSTSLSRFFTRARMAPRSPCSLCMPKTSFVTVPCLFFSTAMVVFLSVFSRPSRPTGLRSFNTFVEWSLFPTSVAVVSTVRTGMRPASRNESKMSLTISVPLLSISSMPSTRSQKRLRLVVARTVVC